MMYPRDAPQIEMKLQKGKDPDATLVSMLSPYDRQLVGVMQPKSVAVKKWIQDEIFERMRKRFNARNADAG